LETLGAGGFATVREAKFKGIEKYKFAIKSMRKKMDKVNMRKAIINELDVLNSLDHPNIANFNECYEDDTFIHAILEFSPGVCLAEMFDKQDSPLPILDSLKIFYQIFNTVSYLRKQEIIHRDYKPPNIMIYKTGEDTLLGYQIQLLDFGLSRRKKVTAKEIFGSPHYLAPEVFEFKTSYPADVWAIGVMLYYSIALEFPFDGETEEDLFKSVKNDPLEFKPFMKWIDVPESIKDLITEMLQKDPTKRINVEKIPGHIAFEEIHKIEQSVSLSRKEKMKLNRYFRLSPIQRKFLKYSTKFIPPLEKTEFCEKFMLLDIECNGYIEFTASDEYSDNSSG
jgi:serine/threonine protein kinase